MSWKAMLLVLAAAGSSTACMDHRRHVESISHGRLVQVGPPLRSSLRAYVALWATPDGLAAEARVQSECPTREVTLVHDVQVTKITATDSRWLAAGACAVTGAAFLATSDDVHPYALLMIGSGFLVAAVPVVAERTKREHLGWREQEAPGLPLKCADRPLSEVTLTLRTSTGTRQAVADSRGRALFAGVASNQVRVVYVDDNAVPFYLLTLTPLPR